MDWEEAAEELEKIIDRAEDLTEKAEDFAYSVIETAEDMRDWILEHERVTARQLTAIENWDNALSRWHV